MDNLLSEINKEGISCAERCDYVALNKKSANKIIVMDEYAT
jgi:hypothetical protein